MRPSVTAILATAFLVTLVACEQAGGESDQAGGVEDDGRFVVEIFAKDFEFDIPASIPSGWTTFRFANQGEQEHFAYVYRLPDGMTIGQFQREALVPFGRVWNQYAAAELTRPEAEAAFGEEIPEWFFTELTPAGGVALTEPGTTAETTVKLEPGTYVVECYVKTPQGTYHTERGMQVELTVTEESNGALPPVADSKITLTNYEFMVDGELASGTRTVAVEVAEDPEGFMMHDINLVRLDAGTSAEEVVAWMDWMDLDQFRAPAPGHSLGGVEHMAAGRTGYMTLDLEPGRYVWVSEAYGSRGMVHEFVVE